MANFNYNRVILGGRLTADPELKTTANGTSWTSFSVAVNRNYGSSQEGQERQADFFNCVAWRTNAEFITRYFRKGSSIALEGTLQNRSWTDSNNQKRYVTEVIVDRAMFVDAKGENDGRNAGGSEPAFSSGSDAGGFDDLSSNDDLPF